MSYGFKTIEELKKDQQIPDEPCKICGAPFATHYTNGDKLRAQGLCFSCNFWQEYVEQKDDPRICRIEGSHYCVSEETNKPGMFKGFGGSKFKIKKGDKIIETSNLWHQGEIPPYFRELLPDNAEFITEQNQ